MEWKADAQHVAVRRDLYSNAFNLISSFEWTFLFGKTHHETTISSRKVFSSDHHLIFLHFFEKGKEKNLSEIFIFDLD